MSARDRGMAIAMLVEAFGLKDFTATRVRVYDKALEAVPVQLLEPMAQRAIQTRSFFPKPSELLADAEAVRVELLAANPYDGCEECEHSRGWRSVVIDGVPRVQRCDCWQWYQARIANLGLSGEPLALPPARERQMAAIGEQE